MKEEQEHTFITFINIDEQALSIWKIPKNIISINGREYARYGGDYHDSFFDNYDASLAAAKTFKSKVLACAAALIKNEEVKFEDKTV